MSKMILMSNRIYDYTWEGIIKKNLKYIFFYKLIKFYYKHLIKIVNNVSK